MTIKEAFVPRSRPITTGKVIALGGLGVLLYVAHVAFIPLALALLFGLILSCACRSATEDTRPRQPKRRTYPCTHAL
jgi:hypothetical protein